MYGLVIDANHENAEYVKFVVETIENKAKVKVMENHEGDFWLIDTSEYDFIIAAMKPVTITDITRQVIPFVKNMLEKKADYMIIKKSSIMNFVDSRSVIGIEVLGKHCYIFTLKGVYAVPRTTMGSLLEVINEPALVRCHRSFAVNVKYIKSFKKDCRHGWEVDLIICTEFCCRVTDTYIDDVLKVFKEHHIVKLSEYVGY